MVDFLNKAVERFKTCFWTLLKLNAFLLLRLFVSGGIGGGLLLLLKLFKVPRLEFPAAILLGIWALYLCYVYFICYIASIAVAVDPSLDRLRAEARGRQKLGQQALISLWMSLVVLGGYLLLLIPGLIFTVWYWFAPLLGEIENRHGRDALVASRELVRGRFWLIAKRLFVVFVLTVGVSAIPVVGFIASFFATQFLLICGQILYTEIKGNESPSHPL